MQDPHAHETCDGPTPRLASWRVRFLLWLVLVVLALASIRVIDRHAMAIQEAPRVGHGEAQRETPFAR